MLRSAEIIRHSSLGEVVTCMTRYLSNLVILKHTNVTQRCVEINVRKFVQTGQLQLEDSRP